MLHDGPRGGLGCKIKSYSLPVATLAVAVTLRHFKNPAKSLSNLAEDGLAPTSFDTDSRSMDRRPLLPPGLTPTPMCRMGYLQCKARLNGEEPIFGQGAGDVAEYCLTCEKFIKLSYRAQVLQGQQRQQQQRLAALYRKSIKVERRRDYRTQGCKLQVDVFSQVVRRPSLMRWAL